MNFPTMKLKTVYKKLVLNLMVLLNPYGLAKNPNTPPEILERLSNHNSWAVRCAVARNPNTLPETLDWLADDEHEWVRGEVAKNPNTPLETLDLLADDEYILNRYWVAYNPNTSQKTLQNKYQAVLIGTKYHYFTKINP